MKTGHGGEDRLDFQEKIHDLYSQSNPLHPDIWPSLTKFEKGNTPMNSRWLLSIVEKFMEKKSDNIIRQDAVLFPAPGPGFRPMFWTDEFLL